MNYSARKKLTALNRYNTASWIETVYDALDPEHFNETEWDDLMTAMAWITEELGYEWDTTDSPTNGELVRA